MQQALARFSTRKFGIEEMKIRKGGQMVAASTS